LCAGGSTNGLNEDSKDSKETQTLLRVLWREMEKQLKRMADPEMQNGLSVRLTEYKKYRSDGNSAVNSLL
jgi:hypothetical protein